MCGAQLENRRKVKITTNSFSYLIARTCFVCNPSQIHSCYIRLSLCFHLSFSRQHTNKNKKKHKNKQKIIHKMQPENDGCVFSCVFVVRKQQTNNFMRKMNEKYEINENLKGFSR